MSDFFQRAWPILLLFAPAIVVGLSMAVSGATLGVFVLLRREALIALALPQVVLVGVAIGLRYLDPLPAHQPPAATQGARVAPTASTAPARDIDAELGLPPAEPPTAPSPPAAAAAPDHGHGHKHAHEHDRKADATRTGPGAIEWLKTHVGWPTLPPAVAATVVALLLVALGRSGRGERTGSTRAAALVLPALYVAAGSVAVLVVAGSAGHLADLQHRYNGIPEAVDEHLAEITAVPLLFVAAVVAALWRRWLLLAQAPAAAQLAGLHPARWDALFLSLLAAAVLLGTNALGVVLVTSLLFLPPAIVLPWCRRVPAVVVASVVAGVLMYAVGFLVSTRMFDASDAGLPLGQSVGGVGAVAFVVSYLASRVRG